MQHACGGGPAAGVDAACLKMGWPRLPNHGPAESQGVGWGHLTSVDLASWVEQPVALAPPFVDIHTGKTQQEQGYAGYLTTGTALRFCLPANLACSALAC
jgi:hypothetical protein